MPHSGSISGQGTNIPHAAEQRSLHATTKVCAPQQKILQDATKIPGRPNKKRIHYIYIYIYK